MDCYQDPFFCVPRSTHAAGRELWGYPKFITPIDFALQKKQRIEKR